MLSLLASALEAARAEKDAAVAEALMGAQTAAQADLQRALDEAVMLTSLIYAYLSLHVYLCMCTYACTIPYAVANLK